jgi:hypothetical protein
MLLFGWARPRGFLLAAGLSFSVWSKIMNRAERRAAERKQMKLAGKAIAPPPPTALAEPVIAPESLPLETRSAPPEPISAARLAANRENSLKSTGPRSPEGKAAVALNAIKTGLTGRTVLLPTDDAAQYQALLLAYQNEFQPVGPEETAFVQSIVDIRWRLDRIPGLEMALFTKGRLEFADLFQDQANVDRSVMLEMHTMLTYEKQFKNLQLQESRLARRREKEMAELRSLQQARKMKEAAALDSATRAYLLARHRNQPFDLAALGFEFSKQRFDAHLACLSSARQDHLLQKALADDTEIMKAAA